MALNRREFVGLAAAGIAAGLLPPVRYALASDRHARSGIKAVAFDAFPIFDPRPIFALAEELFPGRGAALSDEWRSRQFEYT